MKLNEFLKESDIHELNEAPAGFIRQGARKLGSKAAGAVGLQGVSGNLAAKAEVGDEANRIKRELNKYMAGSGLKRGQLQINDFIAFLQKVGFDKNTIVQTIRKHAGDRALNASLEYNISEAVSPQLIDKVIMDLIQLGYRKKGAGKQVRSKYAMPKAKTKKSAKKAVTKKSTAQAVNSQQDSLQAAIDKVKLAGYNVTKAS